MNVLEHMEFIGRLFYVVSPNKTSFESIQQVPRYISRATPDLVFLFLLEIFVSKCLKKSNLRVNDTISCLSQGILMEISGLFLPGLKIGLFLYIHSNWKIVDLPWDATSTWWICFLGVDFGYYWVHRAAHDINFLWATHQVHHSSEDFNISTNVRQSILQHMIIWVLYLPVAFVIPPTAFVVHVQFSYLYQFWIHTELIQSLGPLEYILNTPKHHRLHHGSSRNCIDKNFGGTLIIWDKLFGTFAATEENIVYGLTHPIPTFEPMRIQFDHCIQMWRMFRVCKGWKNKLSVIFKGPGWTPETHSNGVIADVSDVKGRVEKYNPEIPTWCKMYALIQFLLLIQLYTTIRRNYRIFSNPALYGAIVYEVLSLVSIGIFLDGRCDSLRIEFLRCISHIFMDWYFLYFTNYSMTHFEARWVPEGLLTWVYVASVLFWIAHSCLDLDFLQQKKNGIEEIKKDSIKVWIALFTLQY